MDRDDIDLALLDAWSQGAQGRPLRAVSGLATVDQQDRAFAEVGGSASSTADSSPWRTTTST